MEHKKVFDAHTHTLSNKEELKNSTGCGCFYCLRIFSPQEITEWILDKGGETALCPFCGIDSVLGDSAGYPVTEEFMSKMKEYWF